jgi:hypothetical protein
MRFLMKRSRWARLRGLLEWLRRSDSNRRPSGYEPDELPLLHSAMQLYRRPVHPLSEGAQGPGVATGVGGVGEGGAVTR